MTTKSVAVTAVIRNEQGEALGSQTTPGWTEDDGATVKIGLGYLPELGYCLPGDVTVAVTTIDIRQSQNHERTVDEENECQVLSLTY